MTKKDTKGKEYALNLCKLLCGSKSTQVEMDNDWKNHPSFFCSELVAGAYKKADIVEPVKSVSSYFPGDYATGKKIAFKKGFKLGREYIIDFTL